MSVMNPRKPPGEPRPWYREPWPWVLIAIPLLTIAASAVTLWLALSQPDHIVVDEEEYQRIRSELRAQQDTGAEPEAGSSGEDD